MEKYRRLYKDCSLRIESPRRRNVINRGLQESLRNRQRRERFQGARNISLSPTEQKSKVIVKICPEIKENERNASISQYPNRTELVVKVCRETNENENNDTEQEKDEVIRVAKIVCNQTNPEKLSKQEAYLKRFIEWKENKKIKHLKQQEDNANKKKPFLTAVNSNRPTTDTVCSIVPKGHHEDFRPPAGLNIPKVEESQKSALKGRQSIYTIAQTPPRKSKQADEKPVYKFPISRKALPKDLHSKIISTKRSPCKSPLKSSTAKVAAQNVVKSFDSVKSNKIPSDPSKGSLKSKALKMSPPPLLKVVPNNEKTLDGGKSSNKIPSAQPLSRGNLKPKTLKMPPPPPKVFSSNVKGAVSNIEKTSDRVKSSNKISSAQALSRENLKPKALKMLPPPQIPPITATAKQSGAAGKMRNTSSKRAEKQTKKSTLKSGDARLAQNLKAKKPLNNSKKLSSVPIIKLNGKKLLTLCTNKNQEIEDMVIQTPKDFATLPFEEFITSTKLRNSAPNIEEAQVVSLTDNNRPHSNSSAKRNILQDAKNSGEKKMEEGLMKVKKYNFIISDTEETNIGSEQNIIETDEHLEIAADENIAPFNTRESILKDVTLTKSNLDEKPSNYLSPFVSVARGKVSLKAEVEKRNSIYMQSGLHIETLNSSDSSKCSVEVRRTLEAVRYFRQQLQDEIDRLHKSCDMWENYKAENLEKIQNANGEDMINVTIGQTRLLTSKKFMQFKGLIDRCESCATGVGAVVCDGSEGTKPITSADLEGFWSMLKLQVDNLDKRFETLNRWKSNDWMDPDEVTKPKIKKVLSKVKKAKNTAAGIAGKPNSRLQQIMRKMHAEVLKNKKNNGNASPNVILLTQKQRRSGISNSSTPRKSTDNSLTSRHVSIVVKDRKYFSPAATVISIPNPLQRATSENSTKMLPHIKKFNKTLDVMESSLDLTNGTLANIQTPRADRENCFTEYSSPLPSGRKSILKTPGTAKSRMKNVIFNAKLRVKKYSFLTTENGEAAHGADAENNQSTEEDLAQSLNDETEKGDMTQRTLTLRNRQVHLRPSCEIFIPSKSDVL